MKVEEAVTLLRQGNIVFYPTEAVYGVGADPMNPKACDMILKLKGRSSSAGFIIIASNFDQLQPFIDHKVIESLSSFKWPKHTTYVFPMGPQCPPWLVGKFSSIACRITQHPTSKALCQAFGGAIVSTSANPTGLQPARNKACLQDYFGRLCPILSGRLGRAKKPSTIIDWKTKAILRS